MRRKPHLPTVATAPPPHDDARARWPAVRVAWRDNALDQLVRVLAKNDATKELGRRLARYLEVARELEVDGEPRVRRGNDPDSVTHLETWTAERLPELERKRSDSTLRPLKVALFGLEGHFRAWQEQAERSRHVLVRARLRGAPPAGPVSPTLIAARHNVLRRRRWHACVRLAEQGLARDVKAGRLPAPVHPLTPTQRDEVIFKQTGKTRAPKAAAMQLLYLAFRHKAKNGGTTGQDFQNFRIQLEHVRFTPRAL